MKISVLVPVYGVEKYIGECAHSLFSQSYHDIEYIFVDDCSPDASVDVLRRVLDGYPERRGQVRLISHATNRGLGATRSTALRAATGDFVLYADSDDVLMTDAVATLAQVQQQTGADIVSGAYCRLLPDGSLGPAVTPFHGPKEATMKLLLAQNTIGHQAWARLIRRTLHTDNGVDFVEGINMAEDYCIMARLLFFAKCAHTDKVVSQYRVNESSVFSGWLSAKHIGSYLSASRVVGDFLRKHDKSHDYTFAYELGMLNTIHRALAFISMEETERLCPYHPTLPLFRTCKAMLCHKATRPLLRAAYLMVKHFYVNMNS